MCLYKDLSSVFITALFVIVKQLELIQMFNNKCMDKQYGPYNETLLNNKKEWTIDVMQMTIGWISK